MVRVEKRRARVADSSQPENSSMKLTLGSLCSLLMLVVGFPVVADIGPRAGPADAEANREGRHRAEGLLRVQHR